MSCRSAEAKNSFTISQDGQLSFTHPCLEQIVTKYFVENGLNIAEGQQVLLPSYSYSTTIIYANEKPDLSEESLEKYFNENPSLNEEDIKLTDLGHYCDAQSEFNVPINYILLHYPYGDKIRKFLKLKPINFQIVVGPFQSKNLLRLDDFRPSGSHDPTNFLINFPSPVRTKQTEYLEWALANSPNDRRLIIELAKCYPKSSKESAEKVLGLSEKLLDLNDVTGYYIQIKILKATGESNASILRTISKSLFNFTINLETDFDQEQHQEHINFILNFLNQDTNEGETKFYFYEFISKLGQFTKYQMPRNFGWVRPGCTAGSSVPDNADLKIFAKMGIKHVITCLEMPLDKQISKIDGIQIHFFEVEDRTPPTFEQIAKMLQIMSIGEPTVVHCKGGVGRTNTVLACDLIQTENLSSQEAITKIKEIRPKVILDDCQLKFIREFSNRRFCQKVKLPKVLMFVGYPASGKSTISQHICEYLGSDATIRINQDEMGRKKCIDEFNNNLKSSKTIVIDCCNLSKEKRMEWLSMSFHAPTWCIFMDLEIEECKYRIVRRINHPTVKHGLKILESLDNTLEPPQSNEGFERIVSIQKDSEIDLLLKDLGINQPLVVPQDQSGEADSDRIIKFPRTRHLINLGSATRDDLLFSPGEQHEFSNYELQVEEKVDGANLGVMVRNDYKIQVQNRSHFVSSSYHPQFKLLDKWVMKHCDELIQILEPGNEILYGEWLYMKHSIHYTRLPDYFMAFDLYNIRTKTFLGRDKLSKRLENTTICQVPLIAKKKFENCGEIVELLKKKSLFYDGLIEGVYLRSNSTTTSLDRAKVVRQDFICGAGNENKNVRHWTKAQLTINLIENPRQ